LPSRRRSRAGLIRRVRRLILALQFLSDEDLVERLFLLVVRSYADILWRAREAREETYTLGSGVGIHAVCLRFGRIVFGIGELVLFLSADDAAQEGDAFPAVGNEVSYRSVALCRSPGAYTGTP
jgi:hypothetical protein